jgi:hypothetical protein
LDDPWPAGKFWRAGRSPLKIKILNSNLNIFKFKPII